ncbi:hypothetical protein [Allomuricauda sp. SCSIO 65647]|uniref:hypothetical protein n=1 Tax=Allomuricauda sp. SCSIO 65647 TaxID=2908843 RepID=UPI001F3307EF|nr:hypothetical protein [Muricauda sp. SCSIO 65647]UJH69123.1 hypothetical protein L0P89_07890 [Muricauda sp. SCSIO 65647]
MSEKTLDKLIATLKTEAIDAADNEAKQIVEKAQAKAQKIVDGAESKSKELLHHAEKEAEATLNKGEAALKQAARDLTVSVRNELLKLLKAALEREVETNFTPELMEKAVLKVIENVGSGIALQLPETMEAQLAKKIQKRLQDSDNLDSVTKDAHLLNGFTVTKTDQGWSYQISPEEVAELLNAHLSPKWVQILKNESNT